MDKESSLPPPGFDKFLEAQRLASDGKGKCRKCNRTADMDTMVSVHYGGAVAMTLCCDCFMDVDLVLSRTLAGIEVKLRSRQITIVTP